MEPIIFYALLFVAALLVIDAILRMFLGARRSTTEVNARLRALQKTDDQAAAFEDLMRRRGLLVGKERTFALSFLENLYTQSGLRLTPARRIFYFICLFLGGWVLAYVFLATNIVVELILALVFAVVVSVSILLYLRGKRINKFVTQLPSALDIIIRSLHAGHPLNSAISLVAKEMPDPIGSEFGTLSDQLTFGGDLETSMLDMHDRVGAAELKLLAVTVTVQRGTGGNLAEILENLAGMIRARIMLKAKIRAISAEGRITALVMSAFPFFLFWMIRALVPTYFDPLWDSGYGTQVVVGCLVMMSIGIFVLYRLVNFDF